MASLRKRIFPSGKVRWQLDYRDDRGCPTASAIYDQARGGFLAAESEGRSARRSSYPGIRLDQRMRGC